MFIFSDINATWITTVVDKMDNGILGRDNRGKYKRRKTLTGIIQEESITDHINSFPRIESHYIRKNSSKKYLCGDLTVSEMFRLYESWVREKKGVDFVPATKRLYRNIFKNQFNIGFFIPKKDRCGECESFKNLDINRNSGEYKIHVDNAKASQDM